MNTLSKHNWKVTLLDTGDGTGDAFLLLPDDLMALMGWDEADIISLELIWRLYKS
jgi:hypothetical protein